MQRHLRHLIESCCCCVAPCGMVRSSCQCRHQLCSLASCWDCPWCSHVCSCWFVCRVRSLVGLFCCGRGGAVCCRRRLVCLMRWVVGLCCCGHGGVVDWSWSSLAPSFAWCCVDVSSFLWVPNCPQRIGLLAWLLRGQVVVCVLVGSDCSWCFCLWCVRIVQPPFFRRHLGSRAISVQVNIVAVPDHVFHRFPFDLLIQVSATQLS